MSDNVIFGVGDAQVPDLFVDQELNIAVEVVKPSAQWGGRHHAEGC